MSATLLTKLNMPENTRKIFHAVITRVRGRQWADMILGHVTESPVESRRVYLPITTEARRLSRENYHCAQCSTNLTDDEIDDMTFRHDGEVSFYLCDKCQREAFLSAPEEALEPSNIRPVLTHDED